MPKLQNANLLQLSIMVVPVPRGIEAEKIKQTSIIVFALRLRIGGFGLEIYCWQGFLNVQVGEAGQF